MREGPVQGCEDQEMGVRGDPLGAWQPLLSIFYVYFDVTHIECTTINWSHMFL